MFKPVDPKIDFIKLEKKILEWWYSSGLIKKYLHKNDSAKKNFSFLDGPITANNPMGVHHAWGRTLKDLYQRYHNYKGEAERFQNGFDCQGLWVEVEVEKELGLRSKKEIENLVPGDKKASIAKFVQLCKERVYRFSKIQTEQSKRLGYFMDWENSYYTMSDENNYMIWHFLKTCFLKGWIYKGRESIPWCPRCETAISEHEILTEDYRELTHESVYLKLPIIGQENEYLLIWTTTPWTIPANIAVAVEKKYDYALCELKNSEKIWVAKDLAQKIFGNDLERIVKTVKGEKLKDLRYKAPFDDLPAVKKVAKENKDNFHLVILTEENILPITLSEGTGLVHTAVSAGTEDFKLGKKYHLPMIPVIADNADYLPNLGFLSGKNAKKNPRLILDYLLKEKTERGKSFVYKIEKYKHRYPVCWRCKEELVWKVADEWYIAMDKIDPTDSKKRTLRQQMIDVAKKIKWLPEFGLERELDWLRNMHDWLISKKNRYWGLCLPIWECQKCGNFTLIGSKEELRSKAIEGYEKFEGHSPHRPFIDEVKIKCPKCQKKISRILDVGNPWLDAGIVSFSTLIDPKTKKVSYLTDKIYWQKWFPADFITESFPGQFKNWFYSLIAMATVLERKPPFKTVLGYGTLLDEIGRPMHKSLGNAIEFNEGADKIGVDVMRWLYALQNPRDNLLFGYKIAEEVKRRFYLLLWNSYSFFVTYANFNNWQPKNQKFPKTKNILDKWIISRLESTIKTVSLSLDNFNHPEAAKTLEEFVSDLSTWYIRRSRDRVGPLANREEKEECLSTLYFVFIALFKILAPFIPFLAEECYQNLVGKGKKNYLPDNSVHLTDWPQYQNKLINKKLEEEMKLVRKICELGHAERKRLGIKVRQPLKKLKVKSEKVKVNKDLIKLIMDELNVKTIKQETGEKELSVELETTLTPELLAEGEARELVRRIQDLRKKKNCGLKELIIAYLPSWPKEYEDYIKKKALVKEIKKGDELRIE